MCLDRWEGATGYKVFFSVLGVMAVIGLLAGVAWMAVTKEKRRKIQENKRSVIADSVNGEA